MTIKCDQTWHHFTAFAISGYDRSRLRPPSSTLPPRPCGSTGPCTWRSMVGRRLSRPGICNLLLGSNAKYIHTGLKFMRRERFLGGLVWIHLHMPL